MSRYTRKEFEDAGIQPEKCDGGAYRSPVEGGPPYWFACEYHTGYIDGFNAAKEDTE